MDMADLRKLVKYRFDDNSPFPVPSWTFVPL